MRVLLALALLVVIGMASWIVSLGLEESGNAAATQTELERLNQVCDSLLATIEDLNSEEISAADQNDMEWPERTD